VSKSVTDVFVSEGFKRFHLLEN